MKNKSKDKKAIQKKGPSINFQWVIVVVAFVFTYAYTFNSKLDLGGDNFHYISYARNIAKGLGYTSPFSATGGAVGHFPPGYSTLLASTMIILGENVQVMKLLNGLCLLASILFLFFIAKKISGNAMLALSVSLLLAFNSGLLTFASIIMSEMPYMLLGIIGIYALLKWDDQQKFYRSWNFYVLVICIAGSYYFRAIGITLLGGAFIHFAFRKNWQTMLALTGSFIVLYLPWVIRNNIHGIKSRYLGTVMTVNPWRPEEGNITSAGEFFEKMITNFDETVIKGFANVIFPFLEFNYTQPSGFGLVIIGLLVLGLIGFGAWKCGDLRYFFLAYVLGNIFIFMIWHGGNATRYVWPLAPVLTFLFFYGIYALVIQLVKIPQKQIALIPLALLLLLLPFWKSLDTLHQKVRQKHPAAYQNYFALAREVKRMPGADTLMVICRKPAMFHYYSQSFVRNYAYTLDDKEMLNHLLKADADFVILEQLGYGSTYRYLYPAIQKNQRIFRLVKQLKNPDTYLLAFDKELARQQLAQR
jgi:hypothetical protein